MSKNTLFIGNGFDLSIGMKTRYSDFAQSKFWPKDEASPLAQYLNKAKKESNWFDIEALLDKYAKEVKFEEGSAEQIADKKYFEQLRKALAEFLYKAERNYKRSHWSLADKLLKAVSVNGHFDCIYTFNYTCLEQYAISNKMPLLKDSVVHLHGSLLDNSIILGVSDENVPNGYEFLIKSWKPSYHSNDVSGRLKESDLIVFYGLSFGAIDFIYFKDFFEAVINQRYIDANRKRIVVFTNNEQSMYDIYKNLRAIGISINKLKAYSDFIVFNNDSRQDSPIPDKFFEQLKQEK